MSSRPQGRVFTQAECPIGRLTCTSDEALARTAAYDCSEHMMSFLAPSLSDKNKVYGLELCVLSGQIACGCPALDDFRNARKMPYRVEVAGTMAEQEARLRGQYLLPLITRAPKSLCPHARKVRRFIQRHRWMKHFEDREEWLIKLLQEKYPVQLRVA